MLPGAAARHLPHIGGKRVNVGRHIEHDKAAPHHHADIDIIELHACGAAGLHPLVRGMLVFFVNQNISLVHFCLIQLPKHMHNVRCRYQVCANEFSPLGGSQ